MKMSPIPILLILSYFILILDIIVLFNFYNTRFSLFWYLVFFTSLPKLVLLNCDLVHAEFGENKWNNFKIVIKKILNNFLYCNIWKK